MYTFFCNFIIIYVKSKILSVKFTFFLYNFPFFFKFHPLMYSPCRGISYALLKSSAQSEVEISWSVIIVDEWF